MCFLILFAQQMKTSAESYIRPQLFMTSDEVKDFEKGAKTYWIGVWSEFDTKEKMIDEINKLHFKTFTKNVANGIALSAQKLFNLSDKQQVNLRAHIGGLKKFYRAVFVRYKNLGNARKQINHSMRRNLAEMISLTGLLIKTDENIDLSKDFLLYAYRKFKLPN